MVLATETDFETARVSEGWTSAGEVRTGISFQAMGTVCRVDFATESHAQAAEFKQAIVAWVHTFESRFSRFRTDSLIGRINDRAGREWTDTDAEAESLFALCDWFYWSTRGVFDPAIVPLLSLWDYRRPHEALPTEQEIAVALARCGWHRLRREKGRVMLPEPGMGIDMGGIGKEYAVDRVMEMALARGIRNVLIDFGHDLRVSGEPPEGGPWRIGLEDPFDTGRCWGGLAIRDRAVTTSGDYLRNFMTAGHCYGHILDPRTGRPVDNGCRAVTVVAPTCTEAGILSTSAFILGASEGLDLLDAHHQAEGSIWEATTRHDTRRFYEYRMET